MNISNETGYVFPVTLILLCVTALGYADSIGTLFIFSLPDYYSGQNLDTNIVIIVTAIESGNIMVNVPVTRTFINRSLQRGSNYFNISGDVMADNMAVRQKAVYIKTTVDVSVHVFRVLTYLSIYSFMVLPVNSLSDRYIATCYTIGNTYDTGTYVAATALANGTRVNITLPAQRNDSHVIKGSRDQIRQGDLITANLNEYEVVNFGVKRDLTGTKIESNYHVFVTSGAASPIIPYPDTPSFNINAQDVIASLLPVNSWQKKYITIPFMNNLGYVVRITAGTENTKVQIGTELKIIDLSEPGDFHDEILKSSIPLYVSSDKPVSVVQFSNTAPERNVTDKEGDSVMFQAQAINHFTANYSFTVPNSSWMPESKKSAYNYIAISIPSNVSQCLMFDGFFLSDDKVVDRRSVSADGILYEVITVVVTPGFHNLDCNNGSPFGLISYGFTRGSGYGFPVRLKF